MRERSTHAIKRQRMYTTPCTHMRFSATIESNIFSLLLSNTAEKNRLNEHLIIAAANILNISESALPNCHTTAASLHDSFKKELMPVKHKLIVTFCVPCDRTLLRKRTHLLSCCVEVGFRGLTDFDFYIYIL